MFTTNSGEEGKWEGLDVPHILSFTVEAKNGEENFTGLSSPWKNLHAG
jgi:hypothetical protein